MKCIQNIGIHICTQIILSSTNSWRISKASEKLEAAARIYINCTASVERNDSTSAQISHIASPLGSWTTVSSVWNSININLRFSLSQHRDGSLVKLRNTLPRRCGWRWICSHWSIDSMSGGNSMKLWERKRAGERNQRMEGIKNKIHNLRSCLTLRGIRLSSSCMNNPTSVIFFVAQGRICCIFVFQKNKNISDLCFQELGNKGNYCSIDLRKTVVVQKVQKVCLQTLPFSAFSDKHVKIFLVEVGWDIFKRCLDKGLSCIAVSKSKKKIKSKKIWREKHRGRRSYLVWNLKSSHKYSDSLKYENKTFKKHKHCWVKKQHG